MEVLTWLIIILALACGFHKETVWVLFYKFCSHHRVSTNKDQGRDHEV